MSLLPWYRRWTRYFRRRLCAWLGLPVPSNYIENPWLHDFPEGYLLLELIHNGKPLALSWFGEPQDDKKAQNLFRGISGLILALARVPLHRIGSFTFHNNGTISLTNRPLTCGVVILENDGAKRVMESDRTYESVEPYISDLLTTHDNRFISQQNAVIDVADCHYQMAIQMALRAVSYHYTDRDLRQGPFRMQFTDLHQGNLIVDEDWNITCLIDLEWICARSPQMIDVPYWITSKGIDEVCSPDHFAEYTAARESFLTAFRSEEQITSGGIYLSRILDEALDSGATWFFHALDSVNAMYNLFAHQMRPQFLPAQLPEVVYGYFGIFWSRETREIAEAKLKDRQEYDEQLRAIFQVEKEPRSVDDENPPEADAGRL